MRPCPTCRHSQDRFAGSSRLLSKSMPWRWIVGAGCCASTCCKFRVAVLGSRRHHVRPLLLAHSFHSPRKRWISRNVVLIQRVYVAAQIRTLL
jgi:hypothetical protein